MITADQVNAFRKREEEVRHRRFLQLLAQLNAGELLTTKDRRWLCHYRKLADVDAPDKEIRQAIEQQIAFRITQRLTR